MTLSTSLVAVKRITANTPRSQFSHEEIEQAAQAILAVEGIINPIIVQRTGVNSYEVIEGDLEYHAAARAREIDLRKGEMVRVFIVDEEQESAVLEQIKLLRKKNSSSVNSSSESSLEPQTDRIDNLESRFESILQEIKQEQIQQGKYLEEKLAEFDEKMPKPLDPLVQFNEASVVKLVSLLVNAGFAKGKAENVVASIEEERKKGKFSSLTDVSERVVIKYKKPQKGISKERMLEIVDRWSEIFV